MLNKGFTSRVLSLALASGIAVTGFSFNTPVAQAASVNDYGVQANITDGNILHCFDWSYQQIIEELPNIAAAGFTSIQTSPAQAAYRNTDIWWNLYQPVGFRVGDAGLGSEEDLKQLCSEADNYGIKIIVDVVANHLSADHKDSIYDNNDYWHNNGGQSIGDNEYNDRYKITFKNLGGLRDINSEHPFVQEKARDYIQQLKADGVDGIRWDAAKHIALPSENSGFWSSVIDPSMFNYGEILDAPTSGYGKEALMSEYTDYMNVTDTVYSNDVTRKINSGEAPTGYASWTLAAGVDDNEVVYFGETHDTYSNHVSEGGWTKYINQNTIDRAYAIVGSKANSTALYYSRPTETEKDRIKIGAKGSTHFEASEVAAVNKLHNEAVGQSEYYGVSDNVAIVSRKIGATLVNCNKNTSDRSVSLSNPGSHLTPGEYKDEVTGNIFNVTSSNISGTIGSTGIAVLLPTGNNGNDDDDDNNNHNTEKLTVYFSNNKYWNNVYAYTWKNEQGTTSWPGTQMTFVKTNEFGESIYKIEVPADIDGLIFTDNNGNQTVDITSGFANNTGYYISGGNSNKLSVGSYTYK